MKKIYTIGRDESCDIVIPDQTDVISRLHATLRIESSDKIYLIDQSRNGTYVNGMKMSSNVEIPVSRKDVVSFAHIYNLDWSQVPKNRDGVTKYILIALAAVVVLLGIAYIITRGFVPKDVEPTDVPTNQVEIVPQEDTVKCDTVENRDTVVKKAKPKEKKVKNDTVVTAPKQEEVYDPIY